MSGLIPAIGRDGNRLEYLAHYILSAFGTAVPVLRTEDVGVDFFCALGNTEKAGITVSNSYGVQLKSGDKPRLELGGRTKEMEKTGTWRDYELKWFLDLEFPLFFGVPNAQEKRLDLYSTSLARWFGANPKLPFRVRIVPSAPGTSASGIHPDQVGTNAEIANLPPECDGRTYTFNVGPPVISCTVEDLNFPERIDACQQRLRSLLETEHRNTIYRKLGLPYWFWVNHVETNQTHTVAYAYDLARAAIGKEALLVGLVPFICALGLAYKAEGKTDRLAQIQGIAAQLPKEHIPENVMKALHELFG